MKRVVVVGASTGLGRCIGVGLGRRGHAVALMARSQDKLDGAAAEVGGAAFAVRCDATDPDSCREAFAAAAGEMGGIDAVVYAAAVGPLAMLVDATNDQWERAFRTNVVGANNVTQAAIRHLDPASGRVLYMSTTGTSLTAPWPGLGVYQTTKAALDHLVSAWRAEVPGIDFVLATIGECAGGEGDGQSHFTGDWDPDIATEVGPEWFERKLMSGALMDIEHVTDAFEAVIVAGPTLQVPSLTIIPRPPAAAG